MALTDFSALAQFRRLVDLDFDLPRINIQDSVSRRQGLDLRHLGKAIDFFIRVELERMTPSHMLIARQQMYASAPLNMDDMVLRLEVENKLLDAESSIQKYSKGVIGLENIVRPLMDLAYLDSIARSYPYEQGREALDKLLGSRIETESTRDELLQHMRKCKNYLPEVKKSLITGPAFGKIGAEIGGADADLIVDGVL